MNRSYIVFALIAFVLLATNTNATISGLNGTQYLLPNGEPIYGVQYYPTNSSCSVDDANFARIKATGFNTIQIDFRADWYWTAYDTYDFSSFNSCIDKAKTNGLYIIAYLGVRGSNFPVWARNYDFNGDGVGIQDRNAWMYRQTNFPSATPIWVWDVNSLPSYSNKDYNIMLKYFDANVANYYKNTNPTYGNQIIGYILNPNEIQGYYDNSIDANQAWAEWLTKKYATRHMGDGNGLNAGTPIQNLNIDYNYTNQLDINFTSIQDVNIPTNIIYATYPAIYYQDLYDFKNEMAYNLMMNQQNTVKSIDNTKLVMMKIASNTITPYGSDIAFGEKLPWNTIQKTFGDIVAIDPYQEGTISYDYLSQFVSRNENYISEFRAIADNSNKPLIATEFGMQSSAGIIYPNYLFMKLVGALDALDGVVFYAWNGGATAKTGYWLDDSNNLKMLKENAFLFKSLLKKKKMVDGNVNYYVSDFTEMFRAKYYWAQESQGLTKMLKAFVNTRIKYVFENNFNPNTGITIAYSSMIMNPINYNDINKYISDGNTFLFGNRFADHNNWFLSTDGRVSPPKGTLAYMKDNNSNNLTGFSRTQSNTALDFNVSLNAAGILQFPRFTSDQNIYSEINAINGQSGLTNRGSLTNNGISLADDNAGYPMIIWKPINDGNSYTFNFDFGYSVAVTPPKKAQTFERNTSLLLNDLLTKIGINYSADHNSFFRNDSNRLTTLVKWKNADSSSLDQNILLTKNTILRIRLFDANSTYDLNQNLTVDTNYSFNLDDKNYSEIIYNYTAASPHVTLSGIGTTNLAKINSIEDGSFAEIPVWVSSNSNGVVHIYSNLTQDINAQVTVNVNKDCWAITNATWDSQTIPKESFVSCQSTGPFTSLVTLNLNGISPGSSANTLTINSLQVPLGSTDSTNPSFNLTLFDIFLALVLIGLLVGFIIFGMKSGDASSIIIVAVVIVVVYLVYHSLFV